ncbi:MAG: OsmC family protein [Verrucomicrobiota bacterium]
MSQHRAEVIWKRSGSDFSYKSYSRNHEWAFQNGLKIEASAASQFLGDENKIDPEEAFVASLSSCHMLTFLAICSKKGIPVESYRDNAVGYLEKSDEEKFVVTRVELYPAVEFGEGTNLSIGELEELHEQSHYECFLANSVTTSITTIIEQGSGGNG